MIKESEIVPPLTVKVYHPSTEEFNNMDQYLKKIEEDTEYSVGLIKVSASIIFADNIYRIE